MREMMDDDDDADREMKRSAGGRGAGTGPVSHVCSCFSQISESVPT